MDYDRYINTLVYSNDRSAYLAEQRRLDDLFKADALSDVGLAGHPKANVPAYTAKTADGRHPRCDAANFVHCLSFTQKAKEAGNV